VGRNEGSVPLNIPEGESIVEGKTWSGVKEGYRKK